MSVEKLSKSFDNNKILSEISLNVAKGEFFFLLGPSGCGKTTLLRSIAGLVDHESGRIELNGVQIHDLPAYKRDVNTVFQNYALFPHMNVVDNVGFGLKMKRKSNTVINQTVSEMLELVDLTDFRYRFPSQLSGGQMQRVALARALANKPSLLLLDEPLGALDVKLRKQMQNELKRVQKEVGITFVCVTHDQEEALSVGDRIAVMNGGKLDQVGRSEELYNYPTSRFVCDFLGESNFIEIDTSEKIGRDNILTAHKHSLKIVSTRENVLSPSYVAIRPEHISISDSASKNHNKITTRVTDIRFSGPFFEIFTTSNTGLSLLSRIPSNQPSNRIEIGQEVQLSWNTDNVILMH